MTDEQPAEPSQAPTTAPTSEVAPTPETGPTSWPALSMTERRVLGVLVEKQKTTDTYPLTLNAVITGSNQKSNRDPTMNLSSQAAEEALTELQKKGLVMKIISGRVDKWRHLLYETWMVSSVELAVLTELLLRGAQTEGELRARASRMDDIPDLKALHQVVTPLTERKLVVYLTPERRRGTMVTHGFHDPQELEQLQAHAGHAAADSVGPTLTSAGSTSPSRWQDLQDQITQLNGRLDALNDRVALLADEVERLRSAGFEHRLGG